MCFSRCFTDEEEAQKWWTISIPFYNIAVVFRLYIALAEAFHKTTGFGVGLVFLHWLFGSILAFGNATFRDGNAAVASTDAITDAIDTVANTVKEGVSSAFEKNDKN